MQLPHHQSQASNGPLKFKQRLQLQAWILRELIIEPEIVYWVDPVSQIFQSRCLLHFCYFTVVNAHLIE
jgi:hypothetical protein